MIDRASRLTIGDPALQGTYMGPVIDDARRAMLLGLNPVPGPLLAAMAGTACYVLVGYRLFKRLEVNFADIA